LFFIDFVTGIFYYNINTQRDLNRTVTQKEQNIIFIFDTVCSLILTQRI
jgi:hypothetical protein